MHDDDIFVLYDLARGLMFWGTREQCELLRNVKSAYISCALVSWFDYISLDCDILPY